MINVQMFLKPFRFKPKSFLWKKNQGDKVKNSKGISSSATQWRPANENFGIDIIAFPSKFIYFNTYTLLHLSISYKHNVHLFAISKKIIHILNVQ